MKRRAIPNSIPTEERGLRNFHPSVDDVKLDDSAIQAPHFLRRGVGLTMFTIEMFPIGNFRWTVTLNLNGISRSGIFCRQRTDFFVIFPIGK